MSDDTTLPPAPPPPDAPPPQPPSHDIAPITNPNDLAPAIKRAIEVVKRGEPYLIDVVTQPR